MRKLIFILVAVLPIWGMAQDVPKEGNRQAAQESNAQTPQVGSGQMQQGEMGKAAKYETFIYTDKGLADKIQRENESQDRDVSRRFGADLSASFLNAGKGIASGYVTSFIDMGVNAIASLITRKSRQQEEWLQTVQSENSWSTSINTVKEVKDFYVNPSQSGALDPLGMHFNGIGCLRKADNDRDTVFFVSCHIDMDKLYRIVNHSKFELVLDTLILSPSHSNLPNSSLPLEYDFDKRGSFNLSMDIKLTSSWFTEIVELHNDEQLGEFTLSVEIKKDMLDSNGYYRYVRNAGEPSLFAVVGESFIVPRSFMGYRDDTGYHNIWGTGQYKISIDLSETCGVTNEYKKEWNSDRKERKELQAKMGKQGKQSLTSRVWKTITTQKWDEITSQWVITTLTAPSDVIIDGLKLDTSDSDNHDPNGNGGSSPQKPN